MNNWLVIRTRPRWEKKVSHLIAENGIESYCPVNKVERKWSDRIKLIEEPLFRSYVFVKVEDTKRSLVRLTEGVVNFVYHNGKLAKVKEKEIRAIRQFLDKHRSVETIRKNLPLAEGDDCLDEYLISEKGVLIKDKRKSILLTIDSIGFALAVNIDHQSYAVLNK